MLYIIILTCCYCPKITMKIITMYITCIINIIKHDKLKHTLHKKAANEIHYNYKRKNQICNHPTLFILILVWLKNVPFFKTSFGMLEYSQWWSIFKQIWYFLSVCDLDHKPTGNWYIFDLYYRYEHILFIFWEK